MKGWLIRAQQPRNKRMSCKGQPSDPYPSLIQEAAYARAIASPDFQALLRARELPCYKCGNPHYCYRKCCQLDMEGPLAASFHPSGESCSKCPNCLILPAVSVRIIYIYIYIYTYIYI